MLRNTHFVMGNSKFFYIRFHYVLLLLAYIRHMRGL